jgi:hypothetical protein
MQPAETVTPAAALRRAFWSVKVPSMVLMLAPWIAFIAAAQLGYVPSVGPAGFKWFLPTFLGGFLAGWLVWSVQVPRWRLWAYQRVHDIEELKHRAVANQIIWPEGHFFEKTEIAGVRIREQLRLLEERAKSTSRRARP